VKAARLLALWAIAAVPAFGALGGCDGGRVHPFGAYPYDPVHDCLGAAQAVDVLDGPDPGPCAKVLCWVAPSGDVYVTDTACDGPPDFQQQVAGPCALALADYKSSGHGRCPAAPADAGQ
jgi:hypothetical protein